MTGPGGVGKTRLAIEVAGLVAADFPDGVWMVELGPLAEPDAVVATVASTLGVLPQEGVSLVDAIADWLRGKRLLVVIDNCEHVLGPVVEVVSAIVAGCPTVTVMATSRESLGVDGERVAPVPSLAPADAVDLFCDRASAVDDTVAFTSADRQVLAAICARLDGIPLAIELAAARARSLTPADLLDRLGDRFRVLRGGGRGIERHQTLRATVEWSYRLLSDPEKLSFDRLSVFAAGFDLAAAEAVCAGEGIDDSDVVDMLASLVDKSLVAVDRSGRVTRYRLLETLRQYGEERLDERGQTEALRRRHLEHYVGVARAAQALWASPRAVEGAALFNREWDNFRAAHATALDTGDMPLTIALLEATAPHAVLDVRVEYLDWTERTLAHPAGRGLAEAAVYGRAATVAWVSSEFTQAIDLATRGLALVPDDSGPGAALCLAAVGIASLFLGRLDQAQAVVAPLQAAFANCTDPLTVCQCAFSLVTLAAQRDHAPVPGYAERAVAAATPTGSPALLARCAWIEGMQHRLASPPDVPAGLACHRRGVALARDAGARLEVAQNLMAIASVSVHHGLDDADAALTEGISYAHDLRFWPTVWILIAHTAYHLGQSGRPYPAGVLTGHLEAQQPAVLTLIHRSAMFTGAGLSITGPEALQGKSVGAAMDRNELVDYALDTLSGGRNPRTPS